MKKQVTAIFDIGKTNKKLLLFDESYKLVYENEIRFNELKDDDGFECDDIDGMIDWIYTSLQKIIDGNEFDINKLNFSTYGATFVYLDEKGERAAPVYNYLKPMPEDVLQGFYEKYGGIEEFQRITASPALGMLNSGLQILYLKRKKPELFKKVKHILHFPQYLSFLFTKQVVSAYPSIGCHTAVWNFDKMEYHQWLTDEGIQLPKPVSNSKTYKCPVFGKEIEVGIGVHDSSASLVPYLKESKDNEFILVSSGTWAINMNPFSTDVLTIDELKQDCLCYLSVDQKQVKASRLFLGHIHEVNAAKLAKFFNIPENSYKNVNIDKSLLDEMINRNKYLFFPNGIPSDYIGKMDVLDNFKDYNEAYHQLMFEISMIEANTIKLALNKNDKAKEISVSGGFNKNEIFIYILENQFPDKNIKRADIDNATALGAAMVIG